MTRPSLVRVLKHVTVRQSLTALGGGGAAKTQTKTQGDNVNYSWFDLAGNIGVVLMVIAYLLLQLDKLSSSAVSYSLLNAVGALLVILSLIYHFNLSAFLMEVFWLLISLYGLAKPLISGSSRAEV